MKPIKAYFFSSLFLFLLISANEVFCQQGDPQSANVKQSSATADGATSSEQTEQVAADTLRIQLKSIREQLGNINDMLNSDTITADIVGKMVLIHPVYLRNKIDRTTAQLQIKSVEISIRGGTINSVRVKSQDGKIYYQDAMGVPILDLVNHQKKEKGEYEIRQIDAPQTYIKVNELLRYEPAIGNPFLPEDDEFTLTPGLSSKNLEVGVDINSHIEFRVYTDLLALLKNDPNGLIQSELSSTIFLIDAPIDMLGHYLFYMLYYVEPSVQIRKFDSNNTNISLVEEPDLKSISEQTLYDILQRSYLDLRADWSILYLNDGDQKYDFRVGVGYSLSNIMMPDSSVVDAGVITFRTGLKTQLLRYKNFGVSGAVNLSFPKLQKVKEFATDSPMAISEFAFEAFYFPLKDERNKLYARFILNKPIRNEEIIREQPFLQIGYQTKFGFKGGNKTE